MRLVSQINRGIYAGKELQSEPNHVKQWERKRACIGADPDLFDPDAPKWMHERAVENHCSPCPVREMCYMDRAANVDMVGLGGVYGGMMWPVRGGNPMTVEQWHQKHKVGGEFRGSNEPLYPPGWSEERECEGCPEKFTVTSSNVSKRFHDVACRRRFYNTAAK